ncbi:hypothetical protein M5D96_009469, partial [Drosophila gunungcola]
HSLSHPIKRFTRWPEAVPLSTITAETIAASAFWTQWAFRFGSLKKITTDQDPIF